MLLNENCPWCGLPLNNDWNREHIIPKSMGGSGLYNIMRAHKICNRTRNTRLEMIGVYPDTNILIIPYMYESMDEDMLYYTIRAMYVYHRILLRNLQNEIKNLNYNIKALKEDSSDSPWSQLALMTHESTRRQLNDEYTKLNNLVNAIEAGTIDINRNFNET